MEIFNITISVIEQIYTITVFIQGIVNDVRSYESDKEEIQQQLQYKFLFVDVFKSTFFDNKLSQDHYRKQPTALQTDVHTTLTKLQSILYKYGIKAAKHGLLNNVSTLTAGADVSSPQPTAKDHYITGTLSASDKDL